MAFDQLKLEISMLLTQMQNEPEDKWEIHESIMEKLAELKALNLPLPQDLVELETKLAAELNERPDSE